LPISRRPAARYKHVDAQSRRLCDATRLDCNDHTPSFVCRTAKPAGSSFISFNPAVSQRPSGFPLCRSTLDAVVVRGAAPDVQRRPRSSSSTPCQRSEVSALSFSDAFSTKPFPRTVARHHSHLNRVRTRRFNRLRRRASHRELLHATSCPRRTNASLSQLQNAPS